MILTNQAGVPFVRPRREDFASDVDFIRAFHAYRDAIANEANRSFAASFRAAMKESTK